MQRSICWIQIKYWAPGSASRSWRFWNRCDKCTDKFEGMSAIAKSLMKARKCPASRNCIAWSGTMKLNRICFSEIASRVIKGAAGRRWWSPFTEATSVTPSLTPYVCFGVFLLCSFALPSRLLSLSRSLPPLRCPLLRAWRSHQGCFKEGWWLDLMILRSLPT